MKDDNEIICTYEVFRNIAQYHLLQTVDGEELDDALSFSGV
jgi:hypothetical protein